MATHPIPRKCCHEPNPQIYDRQVLPIPQGDQMSLWKNRPRCCPTQFFVKNEYITFPVQNKWPKLLGYTIKKLPIVAKKSQQSPNLVTLLFYQNTCIHVWRSIYMCEGAYLSRQSYLCRNKSKTQSHFFLEPDSVWPDEFVNNSPKM
jgi:hypothetical protein